jgi:RNA polymerase sigma-70 factor, ECF subfamily
MIATDFTSVELAERFASGDDGALREVYDLYAAPMFATALHLLGDREQAADAVQQAFLQAWRSAGRFDPTRELKPWLYAIVRRAAIDTYRRTRRLPVPGLDESTPAPDDLPGLEEAWAAWEVREAVETLPDVERDVMRLTYFDGLTYPEIADKLGVAVGTVKSRAFRAHRRLEALLRHVVEEA